MLILAERAASVCAEILNRKLAFPIEERSIAATACGVVGRLNGKSRVDVEQRSTPIGGIMPA